MLRILIDENLDQRILRGLRRQILRLDYVIAQETELASATDQVLLEWAAVNQRVVVTHDFNTVTKYAYDRVRAGEAMPGVIVIPEDLAIGIAIEELAALIECCEAEEMSDQIKYLPI